MASIHSSRGSRYTSVMIISEMGSSPAKKKIIDIMTSLPCLSLSSYCSDLGTRLQVGGGTGGFYYLAVVSRFGVWRIRAVVLKFPLIPLGICGQQFLKQVNKHGLLELVVNPLQPHSLYAPEYEPMGPIAVPQVSHG